MDTEEKQALVSILYIILFFILLLIVFVFSLPVLIYYTSTWHAYWGVSK